MNHYTLPAKKYTKEDPGRLPTSLQPESCPHRRATLRQTQDDKRGFTLVEILITIGIIGILAAVVIVSLSRTTVKAKDTKRKAEIHQMGRLLQLGCRVPEGGVLDIDLLDYANQLVSQNPQYSSYLSNVPRDPRSGNDTQSGYRYIVSSDGQKCAFYANLENANEPVTLTNISTPTAGGGIGVLQSPSPGPNGTPKYYQFSN